MIKVTLQDLRYAPWGLFTDDEKPQIIVWTTIDNPTAEIDEIMLSELDITRLVETRDQGIIEVEGLEDLIEIPEVEIKSTLANVPVERPIKSEIAPQSMMKDVVSLMREEISRANLEKGEINNQRFSEVKNLLEMPAHKLRKRLKELAKKGGSVSFFRACREQEAKQKNRKTVIAVLLDIIQAKVAAIGIDGLADRLSGQTSLSDSYYDLIEEFEEDEEETEEGEKEGMEIPVYTRVLKTPTAEDFKKARQMVLQGPA